MKLFKYIIIICFFISGAYGQKDSISSNIEIKLKNKYNPLSPSKAAFYSAIFPGAGQIYNKRYWWQLPLIYGGMGAATYYYISNNNAYNRYRTAYKRRKAGMSDQYDGKGDKPLISLKGLERAQLQTRKNREMSMLCLVGTYVLQIVEASVTAHLLQFDDDDDLSIAPVTIPQKNEFETPKLGVSVKYTF